MKSSWYKKSIVFGIIILFVGASIVPSISGNIKKAEDNVINKTIVLSNFDRALVSYWKFNEGSGNTAYDSAGDNDGTIHEATWIDGISGCALEFDGENGEDDYVDCGDDDSLSFGDSLNDYPFTFATWIKINQSAENYIISKYNSHQYRQEYTFKVNAENKLTITLYDTTDVGRIGIKTNVQLDNDNWYFVTATYTGSSLVSGLRLYINGTEIDTTPIILFDYIAMHNTVESFKIGKAIFFGGQSGLFNGTIDEVRIYNRALSEDEIEFLYSNPVADANGPYYGAVGEEITFDASGSYDTNGYIVGYRWDWTNDGTWDTDWLTDPVTTHAYDEEFHGQVKLEVKDNDDLTDTDTADVDIWEPFYFVHISDTHYGYVGARNRVKIIIDDIIKLDPKPAFVIISGDILSWGDISPYGNCSYAIFKDDFNRLKDNGIDYYCCPGNHDYYEFIYGEKNLDKYVSQLGPLDYPVFNANTLIISVNSGCDDFPTYPIFPQKGWGISDLDWIEDILDDLDGDPNNNCDTSNYNKIIFMHHPTINFMYASDGCYCASYDFPWVFSCSEWDAGCIHNNRPQLKSLCDQYDVDAVLSGHIHWNRVYDGSMDWSSSSDDRDGYDYGDFPLSTQDKTLYVNTGAAIDGGYRLIESKSNELIVWFHKKVIDEVVGTISGCPVNLHLYDSAGNHVGRNETGDIEFEIENATYSIYPIDPANLSNISDPATWEHKEEEISLIYGSDNFEYEIEGLGEGTFNFILKKELKDNSYVNLYYENISVTENSSGLLKIFEDSIDYTIYMDDDGDGVIDREIEPTNITTNPPFNPARPDGPISGKPGIEYTYTTNTTDLNGDQIYYMWDWGDGNYSNWLGPYDSGDTCMASYTWSEKGTYEIKVKAKDIYDCESDWSDPLPVTMPRNKAFNFNFNLLSWLFERIPDLFPMLRHILGLQ